jgi:hypothetical protein
VIDRAFAILAGSEADATIRRRRLERAGDCDPQGKRWQPATGANVLKRLAVH